MLPPALACHPLPSPARCWHLLQVLAALLVSPFETTDWPRVSHPIDISPTLILERPLSINDISMGTAVACERCERTRLEQNWGGNLLNLGTNCFYVLVKVMETPSAVWTPTEMTLMKCSSSLLPGFCSSSFLTLVCIDFESGHRWLFTNFLPVAALGVLGYAQIQTQLAWAWLKGHSVFWQSCPDLSNLLSTRVKDVSEYVWLKYLNSLNKRHILYRLEVS